MFEATTASETNISTKLRSVTSQKAVVLTPTGVWTWDLLCKFTVTAWDVLSVVIVTLPVDLRDSDTEFVCPYFSNCWWQYGRSCATLTQERLTLHASLQLIGVEKYVGC
jgi:hypothetical protein